jgi:hypothetical protein
MPLIGFLNSSSANQFPDRVRAFHQGSGEQAMSRITALTA